MINDGSAAFQAAAFALQEGRYEDALNACAQAIAVAQATQNTVGLACCMGIRIEALLGLGDVRQASSMADALEDIVQGTEIPPIYMAPIFGSLAHVSRYCQDPDTTVSRLKRAVDVFAEAIGELDPNKIHPEVHRARANMLDELGHAALQAGQLKVAAEAAEELCGVYSVLSEPTQEADALLKRGQVAEALSDWGEALRFYELSIAAARSTDHGPLIVASLASKAHLLAAQGQYGEALDVFRDLFAARANYEYHEHEAQNTVMMSHAFALTGHPTEALALLEGLSLEPTAPSYSMATLDKAGAYLELGRLADSVKLLESQEKYFEQDTQGDADRLRILGVAYERLGEYASAARYFQKLTLRARQAGDTQNARFAIARLQQDHLETFLSEDQNKSLVTHLERLSELDLPNDRPNSTGEAIGEESDGFLRAFAAMKSAAALRSSGALTESIAEYKSVLNELRSGAMGDELLLGHIHGELGITYRMMGRFNEAEKAYKEAIDLSVSLFPNGPGEVEARVNLTKLYLRLGKLREATEAFAPLGELKETGPHRLMLVECQFELDSAKGEPPDELIPRAEEVIGLAAELGLPDRIPIWQAILGDLLSTFPESWERALKCYDDSLAFFQQHLAFEESMGILIKRARLHAKMDHFEEAFDDMTAALLRAQDVLSRMDSYWLERREMAEVVDWCGEMIAVCYRLGRAERAFEIAEFMRSRILGKLLSSPNDDATERDDALNTSLEKLSARRRELELRFATEEAPSSEEFAEFSYVTSELHRTADLSKSGRRKAESKYGLVGFRSWEAIPIITNDVATAVLELVIDDTGTYALLNSTNHRLPRIKHLPAVTLNYLAEKLLNEWYQPPILEERAVVSNSGSRAVARDQSEFSASLNGILHFIHDKLLSALANDGSSILDELHAMDTRRLVIVPHRLLHLLPIHAAVTLDEEAYDFGELEIGYAPSLTILQRCQTRPALVGHKMTAIADPDLSLPHARKEGRLISNFFDTTLLLEGPEATLQAVQLQCSDGDVSHFACHGRADLSRPLESALYLSDGPLTLEKTLQDIHIKQGALVVLSACETSVSQVSYSDEYLGLAGGFLVAGARCVVSTLWPVDDMATCVFFAKFYSSLMDEHRSIGASLLDAQQFLRTAEHETVVQFCSENGIDSRRLAGVERPLSSPLYWAGFQAIGVFWDTANPTEPRFSD